MLILERCCCCSVRSACLICGVLYLLGSLFMLVDGIHNMTTSIYKSEQQKSELLEAFHNMGMKIKGEDIANFLNINSYINYINLFLSISIAVFSGLMIYGVHNDKPSFLVPSLIFYPIDTLARIVFVAVQGVVIGFLHPICIMLNITCLVGVVIAFFTWLCVFSHHHHLKSPLLSLRECDQQLQEYLQPSPEET